MDENKNFPGWQHKPGKKFTPDNRWGIEFYEELQKIQNLPENQNSPHLKGLSPIDLPGAWLLVDTRPKPNLQNGNQSYENDTLIQETLKQLVAKGVVNRGAADGLRNKIHPLVFSKPEFWEALAQLLKVDQIPGASIRLPRAIEANVMGQGPEFHETITWEWCEEYYQTGKRLLCGRSGRGGASLVNWSGAVDDYVGFRPLVVFS